MMQTPLRLTALLCGFSMISQTEWIRYRIPKTHAIFGDGYRMLTDDDVLQDGDETGCMSTLLSIDCPEKWVSVMPEWADDIGRDRPYSIGRSGHLIAFMNQFGC